MKEKTRLAGLLSFNGHWLARVCADSRLAQHSSEFKSTSRPFNDARNHIEHIDERIERDLNFTGHMAGDYFSMAGEEFDVSENKLKLLTDMYEEVVHVMRTEDPSTRPDGRDPRETVKRSAVGRVALSESRGPE